MFFWRRVAPLIPEEGLKPTATPGYMRNFRDLNDQVSRGKSFSGYERNALFLNRAGNGFSDVGAILGVDFDDDARAVAKVYHCCVVLGVVAHKQRWMGRTRLHAA